MSRITKFLKQKCQVQPYDINLDGTPRLNAYGELEYSTNMLVRPCRCEPFVRDIQTANGAILKTTSRYFLDNTLEIKPDFLLDGKVVLSVESYVNAYGKVEGYEVYT